VLSLEEVRQAWHALERIGTPAALALQIAFATGARIGAVVLAHEDELDLDGTLTADSDGRSLWRVPGTAGRKSRVPQIVPLSGLAVALWHRALAWPGRNSGVVFPGRVDGHSLRPACIPTLWRGWVQDGLLPAGSTPHDLRRSARSWWSGLPHGQTRDVLERLLGHSVGGKVERVYDRSTYLPQQRAVINAWGRWLQTQIAAPGRIAHLTKRDVKAK
jgi:integrase